MVRRKAKRRSKGLNIRENIKSLAVFLVVLSFLLLAIYFFFSPLSIVNKEQSFFNYNLVFAIVCLFFAIFSLVKLK